MERFYSNRQLTKQLQLIRQILESQLNADAREEAEDFALGKIAEAYYQGQRDTEGQKRKGPRWGRRS